MNFKNNALVVLFGLLMASAASAGTVFYDNAATYAQAVTSAPAITFNNGTDQSGRGNSYTEGGVDFTAPWGIYSMYDATYDAGYHDDGYLDLQGYELTMSFAPTKALSFQFAGFYEGTFTLDMTFSNGASYTAHAPGNGYAFFGVSSDTMLTSLSISTNNPFTAFDNLAMGAGVAQAADVPEPGSVALLGLAMFGLLAARRKHGK